MLYAGRMKPPNDLPINVNEGLDDFPTEGLVIEESAPPAPAPPAAEEWQKKHVREYHAWVQAAIKAEDAARAEQKRIERMNIRSYNKRGYGPGYRHEHITLIDRDIQRDMYGRPFSDGWWLARCDCGATIRVQTRWVRVNLRKSRACQACLERIPPKRSENPGGRPHKHLEGMVIGRLTVNLWYPGIGWLCTCATCGGKEACKNSAEVTRRGTRGCDGTCVSADVSAER